MELFKPRATINFMKYRGPLIIGSLFLAVLGFLSVFWPGPNYGIDFKGGTEVQLKFGKGVTPTEVRNSLAQAGYDAEVVTVEGREGEYLVRVGRVSSLSPEQIAKINKTAGTKIDGVEVEDLKVSPGGDKIALRMRGEVQPAAIESALKTAGA